MVELVYGMVGNGPTLTAAAIADLVPPVRIPAGMARQGGMIRARLMGKISSVITTPGTVTLTMFIGALPWSPNVIYKVGDRVCGAANLTYALKGPLPWKPNTAYTVAGVPNLVNSHGRTYTCATAGISGNLGGPIGVGAGEVDGTGTLTWDYVAGAPGLSSAATPPAGAADINEGNCEWDYIAAAAPFVVSEAIDQVDNAACTDLPWILEMDMIVKGATILAMGSYQSYNLEKIITPWGSRRLIPAATPAAVAFNPEIDNYLRFCFTPSVNTGSMTCMIYTVEGMAPMEMYGW